MTPELKRQAIEIMESQIDKLYKDISKLKSEEGEFQMDKYSYGNPITVRQLINELMDIENKDLPIKLGQHYNDGDAGANALYDLCQDEDSVYIEFC